MEIATLSQYDDWYDICKELGIPTDTKTVVIKFELVEVIEGVN